MDYLIQLNKIITSILEVEEDATYMKDKPTVRRAIRAKSLLRASKKEIDILMDELEVHKKSLIKSGDSSKELAQAIEEEFSN